MNTTKNLTMAAVGLFGLIATTGLMTGSALAQHGHHHHHGHHGGGGWIGPAIIGGALLGGLAATAPAYGYARECWLERRRFVDEYGRHFVRRVRVCN